MFPFALMLIAPLAMASSFAAAEPIPVPGEDVPQPCPRAAETRKETQSPAQPPAAPANGEKKSKKEEPRRWRLEAL